MQASGSCEAAPPLIRFPLRRVPLSLLFSSSSSFPLLLPLYLPPFSNPTRPHCPIPFPPPLPSRLL
jgi:hypothetical protein